jgi:hypothetical protein
LGISGAWARRAREPRLEIWGIDWSIEEIEWDAEGVIYWSVLGVFDCSCNIGSLLPWAVHPSTRLAIPSTIIQTDQNIDVEPDITACAESSGQLFHGRLPPRLSEEKVVNLILLRQTTVRIFRGRFYLWMSFASTCSSPRITLIAARREEILAIRLRKPSLTECGNRYG